MKKKIYTLLLLAVLLNMGLAQSPFIYTDKSQLFDIQKGAKYYVDSSKTMDLTAVLRLPNSAFKRNENAVFNYGNTDFPFWLCLDFENKTDENLFFLLENHEVRWIDAYLLNEKDSIVKEWKAGVMRPYGRSYFNLLYTNFHLGKQPQRLYLRLHSPSMYVPMRLGSLQSMVNYVYSYSHFYGIMLGILFALIIYNLFLYIIVKDNLYIYYILYVLAAAYIVIRAKGFHHQYLWQNSPNMTYDINTSSVIFMTFSILFFAKFLDAKRTAPVLFKIILGLGAICFILLPIEYFVYIPKVNDFIQLTFILILLLQMIASIYVWWSGFTLARFYVMAWILGNLGSIGILLGMLGVLPMTQFLVYHSFQIGMVLESLFMAFAVADRINIYRQEAHDANALSLQRAYENEELQAKQALLIEEKLKLEQNSQQNKSFSELPELLQTLRLERNKNRKLSIPTTEGVLWIPIQDIIRLEAMRSYCAIHVPNGKKIIASNPLSEFEKQLEETEFMRVHKSHMVNLNQVREYIRGEGGSLILKDGSTISVSRTAKATLLERLTTAN